MKLLNPYESPRTESELLDTAPLPRAFRVRVVILLIGTISFIGVRYLTSTLDLLVQLVLPQSIVTVTVVAVYWRHPSDSLAEFEKTRERARLSVGLIWTILPMGALMQAYSGVSGVYDPVRDDGYRHSLTVWWGIQLATLLPAVVLTLLYAFHPRAAAMRPVNRFVVASWVIQLLSTPVRFYFKL